MNLEKESEGKNKIWLYIMLFLIFFGISNFIYAIINWINKKDFATNSVTRNSIYISGSIIILIIIGYFLLRRIYYKISIFSKDELRLNEDGKIIVSEYDEELEKKVNESFSEVDKAMNE